MDIQNLSLAVLETIDSLIYLADIETHELVYVNPLGEKVFNITKKDWENKKYFQVLLGIDTQPEICANNNLQEGIFTVWQRYNAITEKYFKVHATIKEYGGRKMRFVIAHDITDNINYAKTLERNLAQTDILNSCLETLIKPLEMNNAIDSLLEMLGNYYNADRIHIVHVKNDTIDSKEIFEWAQKQDPQASKVLEDLSSAEITAWFNTNKSQDIISFDSQELLDDSSELFTQNGVSSFLAVPLRNDACEIIGFIGIVNAQENFHNKHLIRSIARFYENYYLKNLHTKNLYKLSHVDSMTELFNRNCFEEKYKKYLEGSYQNLGILYVDLNDLKLTNDMKGHKAGDMLICSCAQILKDVFYDNCYRIGGDEFVILMENVSQDKFNAQIKNFEASVLKNVKLHLSYGYLWNDGSLNISDHICQAEAMMYENKKNYYANLKNRRQPYGYKV